ncbi:unnamed protein product, partial [Symbiodinium sp. CCMP2456]
VKAEKAEDKAADAPGDREAEVGESSQGHHAARGREEPRGRRGSRSRESKGSGRPEGRRSHHAEEHDDCC